MEDFIRRTLGFIMLNWPMLLLLLPSVRWVWRGNNKD